MSKQLNASCAFQDSLLVCNLTRDVVQEGVKVNTKQGKHTLIEDRYSRTENFHPWDRADRRVQTNTRKRKMLRCTNNNNNTQTDSVKSNNSGTCIPIGKGLGYPPLVLFPMGPRSEHHKIYHRLNTIKRMALSKQFCQILM